MGDRPGREIPQEYREVVEHLINNRGWRYDNQRKGHPTLYPADRNQTPYQVPTTPNRNPRAWKNWVSGIRRRGGDWPPAKEG